jgi:hypothetical protein
MPAARCHIGAQGRRIGIGAAEGAAGKPGGAGIVQIGRLMCKMRPAAATRDDPEWAEVAAHAQCRVIGAAVDQRGRNLKPSHRRVSGCGRRAPAHKIVEDAATAGPERRPATIRLAAAPPGTSIAPFCRNAKPPSCSAIPT